MGNAISCKKDGRSIRRISIGRRGDATTNNNRGSAPTTTTAATTDRNLKTTQRLSFTGLRWSVKRSSNPNSVSHEQQPIAKLKKKSKGFNTHIHKGLIGDPSNFRHVGHMGGGDYRTGAVNPTFVNQQMADSSALMPIDQPELTMPFLKSVDEVQKRPPTPPILTTPEPTLEENYGMVSDVLSPPPRSLRDREFSSEERDSQVYTSKSSHRRGKRPFSYDPAMSEMVKKSLQLPSAAPKMDRGPNISATGRTSPVNFNSSTTTLGKPKQVPLKDCPSELDTRAVQRRSSLPHSPSCTAFERNNSIAIGQPIWDSKQINSVWNEQSISAPSTMRRSMQDEYLRHSQHMNKTEESGLEPSPVKPIKSKDAARRYVSKSEGSLGLDLETSALFGLNEPSSRSTHSLGDQL